jgi:hypothetical protein
VAGPEHDMAILTVSSTCKVCIFPGVHSTGSHMSSHFSISNLAKR